MVKCSGLANKPLPRLDLRGRAGPQCYWRRESLCWGIRVVPLGVVALKQCLSKCGPWTSRISNNWKPMRNSSSQALPQPTESDTRPPGDSDALKFENHQFGGTKPLIKPYLKGESTGWGVTVSKSPFFCPLFFQCLHWLNPTKS